jgi:CheY-like chemotaxis protein
MIATESLGSRYSSSSRRIRGGITMRAAVSTVWVMSEKAVPDALEDNDTGKKGNGQPGPSTILVVEDEVIVRLAVADYLRRCGYRVVEAKTGEEAQAILRAGELVEILFSDVNLGPGINGFELAKWTRENYRDIRILLTSGASRMAQTAEGLCDAPLFSKPYPYEHLVDQISKLLGALGRRSGS